MAEYFSDYRHRVLTARFNWRCDECGGIIYRGTEYLNIDHIPEGARWQCRKHLNCLLPWYVPAGVHRCLGMGKLAGKVPEGHEPDPRLKDLPITIRSTEGPAGTVNLNLSDDLRDRFLNAQKPQDRLQAQHEIELMLTLFSQMIAFGCGHRRRAKELSNRLEELQQWMDAELGFEEKVHEHMPK